MTRLLGGQIGLDDFIFAHVMGGAKTVTITKQEVSIGLTITDNGDGSAFIKKIKEGSVAAELSSISVGDMVAAIDGRGLVGCKHFEVAKMLKEIPRYTTFTMELIEPLKPFGMCVCACMCVITFLPLLPSPLSHSLPPPLPRSSLLPSFLPSRSPLPLPPSLSIPSAIAPRNTTSKSSRPLSQLLEDSSTHLEATGGRGTLRLKTDGAATVEENVL